MATLERSLGLDSAAALVAGEVIGVGIFLTPAQMARDLGSPAAVLIVWLGVGAAALCGALSYAELGSRYPEAGGPYVYLRRAWGPAVAFLYGWKCMLVMDPGLTAALAAGFASQATAPAALSPVGEKALAIVAILALAALNAIGVRRGARLLRLVTALKLGLLALVIGWGFASGRGEWSRLSLATAGRSLPSLSGLASGLVAAFFCVAGFWDVAKLAGEIRDPARNLPRALLLGVAVVVAACILTNGVFLYLVPSESAESSDAFALVVGRILFGAAGAGVLSAVVMVTILGSLAAVMMAAPRVYFAMARDGLFVSTAGQVDRRFGTPLRAIIVQAALACLLVALGSFGAIVGYFIFVTIVFVALTVAGLYRLPRPAIGGYRVPGYPWTPACFLALLAVLLLVIALGSPREAAAGTGVVALGVPVYRLLASSRDRVVVPSLEES